MLDFFRVRCSANRSGDPIVAEKRPDCHVINDPELQAWIEMAHRPLIEVDDAARRQRPHVIYLDDDLLAHSLDEGIFGLAPYWTPPNFSRKLVLMAAAQTEGS